jgi:hypothetical protein
MSNREKSNQDKNVINVDPATLLLVVVALLLIPLLLAGFLSQ